MAQRAGVSFEVDRLELEDDQLVVSGFWSGVRGLRFVRPTLVSEDRRILATLEHKPWAPSPDAPWTAAFPWDGDDVDADRLALAVSPQVTVPLGAGRPVLAAVEDAAGTPASRGSLAIAGRSLARASSSPEDEDEGAPPPATQASPLPPPRAIDSLPRASVATGPELAALQFERDDLLRERAAAERARDRALEQLTEAIDAREAAVRTRARMQLVHDEAIEARERAETALARAQAEREEANAQRDEVLLAYRALRRQMHGEQAGQDRATASAAHPDAAAAPRATEPATDEPIGVRTVPAARTVAPELRDPRREQKLVLSPFDLWIIRVLGTVAAGCFILLLFSILRVFL